MQATVQRKKNNLLVASVKSKKWEIDLHLYFLIIILFPTSITEKSVTSSLSQFWYWTLLKFVQLIIAYFIFRAVKNYLQSMGKTKFNIYQIIFIGFAVGSTSSFIFYLVLNYANFFYSERTYLSFFISNGFMGAIWLPICSAASISYRKFTRMNELLRSQLSPPVIKEIKQSKIFKFAVANEDRITINQILNLIENSKNDHIKTDLTKVGHRKVTKKKLNPFLFIDTVTKFNSFVSNSLSSYKYSVQYKPLNPLYFTFVITFIIAISVLKNDITLHALIIVSYFAIYTYFFHSLQVFFHQKIHHWFWLSSLCDLLNVLALTATGYVLNKYYNYFTNFNTSMIITYTTVILLYIFLHFTGHVSQSASIKYSQHKKILEKYLNSEAFTIKILNQELDQDALKWEQIIHGKLQSKLLSHSVTSKNVSDNQRLTDEIFIDEIRDLMYESIATPKHSELSPIQIVALVSKPWSAVIEVESDLDKNFAMQKLSDPLTSTVTDVLEEAITNAVKHGGADNVWVTMKGELNNYLQFQVKNNGVPVDKSKRKRIGTNLFNRSGIWSLNNEGEFVVFRIQIDI